MSLSTDVILDFNQKTKLTDWYIVNDGVMGGLSESTFTLSPEGNAVFSGEVSLENNGGFASVWWRPNTLDVPTAKGIKLRVKGDGKTYKLRIRTSNEPGIPSYTQSFSTEKDTWMTIQLPYNDFTGTWRGTPVPDMPKLESKDIQQLGFLISDKQEGAFALQIDRIEVSS